MNAKRALERTVELAIIRTIDAIPQLEKLDEESYCRIVLTALESIAEGKRMRLDELREAVE